MDPGVTFLTRDQAADGYGDSAGDKRVRLYSATTTSAMDVTNFEGGYLEILSGLLPMPLDEQGNLPDFVIDDLIQ